MNEYRRELADGSTALVSWRESPGAEPSDWTLDDVPDGVLEIISRLQPELPEGVTVTLDRSPDGVWVVAGRRGADTVCLVCGASVGGTVRITPPSWSAAPIGPVVGICTPVVCEECGDRMAPSRPAS
jgi:hypothetical protein